MSEYKVGDRVWWHGSKLLIVRETDRFYVHVGSSSINGAIFKRFVKPIKTCYATLGKTGV